MYFLPKLFTVNSNLFTMLISRSCCRDLQSKNHKKDKKELQFKTNVQMIINKGKPSHDPKFHSPTSLFKYFDFHLNSGAIVTKTKFSNRSYITLCSGNRNMSLTITSRRLLSFEDTQKPKNEANTLKTPAVMISLDAAA